MSARSEAQDLLGVRGKTAMVAGGGGGIGGAVVSSLLGAGAAVVSTDLPGRPGPEGSEFMPCDLSDAGQVETLFRDFSSTHEHLDILVHSVGIARDAVLWKMKDDDWSRVLRVNLDSAFWMLKRAVPLMRATGGGAVVLISSINGQRGRFGLSNYSASKAGLIGLGRTAATETGRFGIRVNMVAPGLIETPMTENYPDDFKRGEEEESALGRIGQPNDVASAVLFLVSSMSRHITGQVLRVDGGQLIA